MGQPTDNLVKNAIGREVPGQINGEQAIAFKAIGQYLPEATKHAPGIRSCADYPFHGDRKVGSFSRGLQ